MKISSKAALFGDLHIGVNKNSEEFYNLTHKWIKYFVEEITKRKINTVFVLGDWHHYRDEISVQTLDVSAEIMGMFPKNINVHILTGNHDCYFKDTSEIHSLQMFKGWENVFVYDKLTQLKTVNDKRITIIPWGVDIKDSSNSDYVFGHFDIQNFKMNNFTICDKGLESKELLSKSKEIYTGHFHKYQNKKYKSGQITYVGSPFQHDFNDVDNENGFHILDFDSGECEFVKNSDEFPVFKYVKMSKIKDMKADDLQNNYIKFFVDIELTEKQLEKTTAKLWSCNPKNLIVDDLSCKKVLELVKDVKIESVNIELSIKEFIDTLDDQIQYKKETLTKIKEIYERKTK